MIRRAGRQRARSPSRWMASRSACASSKCRRLACRTGGIWRTKSAAGYLRVRLTLIEERARGSKTRRTRTTRGGTSSRLSSRPKPTLVRRSSLEAVDFLAALKISRPGRIRARRCAVEEIARAGRRAREGCRAAPTRDHGGTGPRPRLARPRALGSPHRRRAAARGDGRAPAALRGHALENTR